MLPAYFNAAAGTVRKNKNFVFGSTDGAIELPMNVKFPDYKFSRLVFSDFHLSYQPVYPGVKDSPLQKSIDETDVLELAYDEKTDEIVAPTFRQDIHCNADVAEEVARFYGYDKIPMTLPTGEATTGKLPFKLRIQEVARDIAEYCGFSEGMSYSFESPKVFDKLCIPEDSDLRKVITISNPLGEDYSIMRTSTLNGMLASLSTNYNRRNKDVRLYELGNIYLPSVPCLHLECTEKAISLI